MILRRILEAFNTAPGPMSLSLLAAQLDLERPVLEGMLLELVHMGRLVRIDDRTGTACAACGIKGRCPYLLATTGTYYALPHMVAPNDHCGSPIQR